jgi:hypothetical protein
MTKAFLTGYSIPLGYFRSIFPKFLSWLWHKN